MVCLLFPPFKSFMEADESRSKEFADYPSVGPFTPDD